MNPNKGHPRTDGTLWGFNTLEQTRSLGQQTYQRALKNYAAAWRDQQKTTVFPTHVHHGRFQHGPCPICGKSVEPNHHLDSAFSEVMKMMSHISRSCEKYYCTSGKEQETPHDKKHCLRYHTGHQTADSTSTKKFYPRETCKEFSLNRSGESSSKETYSKPEIIKNKHHTFDIAASLPSRRKTKHGCSSKDYLGDVEPNISKRIL